MSNVDTRPRPNDTKKFVDMNYLLKEAPREKHFITGAQAMAEAVKRANVDMAIAYPITPQSEVMHLVGDIYAQGHIKEYYRAEEELGTMSAIAGAARAGVRLFTATSGPGLLTWSRGDRFMVWSQCSSCKIGRAHV